MQLNQLLRDSRQYSGRRVAPRLQCRAGEAQQRGGCPEGVRTACTGKAAAQEREAPEHRDRSERPGLRTEEALSSSEVGRGADLAAATAAFTSALQHVARPVSVREPAGPIPLSRSEPEAHAEHPLRHLRHQATLLPRTARPWLLELREPLADRLAYLPTVAVCYENLVLLIFRRVGPYQRGQNGPTAARLVSQRCGWIEHRHEEFARPRHG